jgi:uncharacterized membrane protein
MPRKNVSETVGVSELTHQNIESILCLEDKEKRSKPWLYKAVAKAAAFCGTVAFLWANVAVFAAWIAVNEVFIRVDPYPFTFLLFLVSLEAIFLSVLILISQNMASEVSERRHHLDLQINLLNEREMTALLKLSLRMAEKLKMDDDDLTEIRALTEDTDPGAVLHQIVDAELAHR